MIQEYFWKNEYKLFFHFGNYSTQKQRFPKDALDPYMIDSFGEKTNITNFDMIRSNSDADVSQQACLSLLEWANYLLEPYAGIDNNDDSKLHNDNDQKGPMMSYKITDDEINWKKETETDTTVTNATESAPAPEEHLLWNKFALDGNKQSKAALKSKIAEALHVSHSRYIKMKRLTNAQKQEKETIELGMLSIMQMHCNETNAKNDENWKDTLNDIVTCYHTEVK